MYICNRIGEMAEWSNALVLKTSEGHTSGGSNPSLSPLYQFKTPLFTGVFCIRVLFDSLNLPLIA